MRQGKKKMVREVGRTSVEPGINKARTTVWLPNYTG
jgi:hypothetical protein